MIIFGCVKSTLFITIINIYCFSKVSDQNFTIYKLLGPENGPLYEPNVVAVVVLVAKQSVEKSLRLSQLIRNGFG